MAQWLRALVNDVFSDQHPYGDQLASITLVPEDLVPFF